MKLEVQGRPAYAYTGGKPFDATRPVIVFVHGASNDHSVWTLLARWCAHHGLAPLAVDLPGHMNSAGPALGSVEALGSWVLALLDAAGVPAGHPVTLVGHSMGSLIALEAAAQGAAAQGTLAQGTSAQAVATQEAVAQRPARVSRLVMVATAYPMQVAPALLDTAAEQPEAAMRLVNAWSFAGTASKPSFPGPGMWLHGAGMALMQRVQAVAAAEAARSADVAHPGHNLFLHDFRLCDAYRGGLEAAARVTAHSTLLLGRHDLMTPPRTTRELAAALRAQVVTVASGHHLMAEAPDAVLNALQAALNAPAAPEESPA
jgi:pimeloyl-ACP methyl ester carboxylesterase